MRTLMRPRFRLQRYEDFLGCANLKEQNYSKLSKIQQRPTAYLLFIGEYISSTTIPQTTTNGSEPRCRYSWQDVLVKVLYTVYRISFSWVLKLAV